MIKIRKHYTIAVITLTAVVVVWVVDAFVDSFFFKEATFLQLVSDVSFSLHRPHLHLLLFLSLILFGIVVGRITKQNNLIQEILQKHSAAIEASMDGIAIYNPDGEYIYVNQAYASVNGYDSHKEVIGKSFKLVYTEKELERIEQTLLPILQKSRKWRGELIAKRKNGSTYFQEASVTMLEDGGRICIVRDITWRKRSEERLHRSERFLNTIFDSIRDPFCIFDSSFRIIRINEAYAQLKNKSASEMIGRKCYEVLEGKASPCEGCIVFKSFNSADPCAKEKLVTLHDGTEIWVEIYTYPILDDEGKASHVMEYTRDITERKKSEDEKRKLIERLEYLSRTDSLTGLINRRVLTDSLTYEIDRAKRYGSELSLVLCDIDNFKGINDKYGHDAGDAALQTLSATLKTMLRKTDIAGRYGGDEFMFILPETSLSGAESLADKFLSQIRNTDLRFKEGRPTRLSLSIGIACMTGEGESIDSLVKRADDAMYNSKQNGRNRVSVTRA